MVHVMLLPMLNVLYFYISPFQSMCALPNMAVFCSSLISERFCDGSISPYYYWYHFCFYIPHSHTDTHSISVVRSLYFRIFLTSFLITFLSPGIVTSVHYHRLWCLFYC